MAVHSFNPCLLINQQCYAICNYFLQVLLKTSGKSHCTTDFGCCLRNSILTIFTLFLAYFISLSLHFFLYLCGSAFAFPMIVLDHYYSVLTETGPYCINWLSAHTAITGNSSNITKYAYLYGFFPHLSLVSFLDHDSATSSFSWCLYRDIVLIC